MCQDEIETLSRLGLTTLEAKTYLFLASYDAASIREISQGTNIARTEIFRAINGLQNLGLIEKILSYPSQYRSVPLPQGIQILMERKENEHAELLGKATNLIYHCLNDKKREKDRSTLNPEFVMLPKGELNRYKFRLTFSGAQTKIDSIVPWKTLLQSNVDAFKKALNKKIMFRYIINRPQDERLVEKFLSDYTLNEKSFVVRFIGKPPEVVMRIIDVKEAFISTIEGINPIEDKTPTLWSSNRCLIKMAQKYFDSMWESAEGQ